MYNAIYCIVLILYFTNDVITKNIYIIITVFNIIIEVLFIYFTYLNPNSVNSNFNFYIIYIFALYEVLTNY